LQFALEKSEDDPRNEWLIDERPAIRKGEHLPSRKQHENAGGLKAN
jgi:hypothetical protein